ncbi:MAG TPA: DUF2339 domain-containing protein [Gaiellales bacterium]|nr:DUF2339 domain-containing protein [Gaiellales bacterium]
MSRDDDITRAEIVALSAQVGSLTRRVYQLEQTIESLRAARPAPTPAPQPSTYVVPPRQPAAPAPVTPRRATPPPAAPRRPVAPRPQRAPVNWSKLAEQAFAARTLAWAGGIATALGVALLFVLAASRGWVTPEMRVGLGVLVSLGLLGAAFDLDRRGWRADAILSAGGAGIAGLYATLWASISMYHFISEALGLPCAAAIAALAVGLAIRIRQEPLAIFGIVAAMLAPTLVSQDVTGGGALFSFVIACAGLPLFWRYRWTWLLVSIWGTAVLTLAPLYLTTHSGLSSAVLAGALFFGLFMAEGLVSELRLDRRDRITELGWLLLGTSVLLSFAVSFLYAGDREVLGRHLSGFVLLGVAGLYALLAVTPLLLRRRHADVTDLLAGFGLAALATATGLLLGGPGMVCGWAAESVVMIGVSERLLIRHGTRRLRLTIASGVYLLLAAFQTLLITAPTEVHLASVGAGSAGGSVALGAVTLAGIVFCFGLRVFAVRELRFVSLLPATALGYLPVWALGGQWAVIAYAALAAALFGYRRSPWMVAWLDDQVSVFVATSYWLAGLGVSAAVAAPLSAIDHGQFGNRDGLAGLAALVASGIVGTWSVRRLPIREIEYAALAPAAVFGYLVCESLSQYQAMWTALAVTTVAATAVHIPALRRRIGEGPLLVIGAGYLGAAVAGLLSLDDAGRAIANHGQSNGWGTLLAAVAAAFVLATAVRDPRLRGYAMWLPATLAGWLATLVLHGQYPLVCWAGISVIVSAFVIWRPASLERRIVRQPLRELAAVSAALVTVLVVAVYETPHMLFTTNHDPADGLAAALASVVALAFLIASAATPRADGQRWQLGGVRVATAAAVTTCAMALWTLAAAILGAGQLLVQNASPAFQDVHDRFQQGHVLVSVSWVLTGLALVVISLRGNRRSLRIAGIALLFAALGKLFLYDLAFLTAMARAVSFIVTGSVLLVAALLLQRFSPQVKAVLGDDGAAGQAS